MNETQPIQQQTPYESTILPMVYRQNLEKSMIDKLLGRKEIESLRKIIRKRDLEREDLLELLYMLTGVELKLANLNEYDRYMLGKYFVWVREFVKIAEFLFDYKEKLEVISFTNEQTKIFIQKVLKDMMALHLHNVKFSVDIFLYLSRSTLGLTMAGFDKLSTNRFEYEYSQPSPLPANQAPEQRSFFGIRLGGGR